MKAVQTQHDDDLDRDAWMLAQAQFSHLQATLPPEAVGSVAREVVRRLAFRLPRQAEGNPAPDAADIARFCATLTAAHDDSAERFILNLRRGGQSTPTIYLSFIAAAARELGRQWDDDRLSFAEVTMASGRLYRIIRGLRHVLDQDGPRPDNARRILLALLPGDTHTLASDMAADLFRRDGWEVDLAVAEDHDSIIARADVARLAAVVIVSNDSRTVAPVTRLVVGLRIVAPMVPVVLAGKILDTAMVCELCGADAGLDSLENAVAQLRIITDQTFRSPRDSDVADDESLASHANGTRPDHMLN